MTSNKPRMTCFLDKVSRLMTANMKKFNLFGLFFLLQTSVLAAAPVSDRVMLDVGGTSAYLEVLGRARKPLSCCSCTAALAA